MIQDALNFDLRRPFPVVRQSGQAECGHACLAMISTFHGRSMSLLEVRQIQAPSSRGMTLQQLMALAALMHLETRPIKLELDDLQKVSGPVILHWSFNHFVVLVSATSDAITIADPAQGLRTVPLKEASEHFTGVAVDIAPTDAMPTKDHALKLTLPQLIGRVRGLGSAGWNIFAVAAVLEFLSLLAPLFGQVVGDHVLLTKDSDLLLLIGCGFGAAMLMRTYFAFVRDWIVLAVATSVRLQVAARLVGHVLRLPAAFFEQRQSIDIQQRLDSLQEVERVLATSFLQAIIDSMMALVVVALIFAYSTTLGLVSVSSLSLYAVLRLSTLNLIRNVRGAAVSNQVKQSSHMVETLRSIVPLKLASKIDWRLTQWKNLAAETANAQVSQAKIELVMRVANSTLMGATSILFMSLAALQVMNGGLSFGSLFALAGFQALIATRLTSLIDGYMQVKLLSVHLDRLADFVFTQAEPRDAPRLAGQDDSLTPLSIELRNVSFRFSEMDPWVLKDVNMTVGAGENVCLTGPSGSGKSTLLKILTGVFQPTTGEVLVNGLPLAEFGLSKFHGLSGVVLQNDRLYFGSIADNISFFDADPDQGLVQRAADAAAVHAEIARMPMNYQTLCGEDGSGLSGGQAQRLFIARALYRQPSVLLMDEATSNLDVPTEQKVNAALRALKTTRVFIAHRPQTIASADRVYVLDGGQLSEPAAAPIALQA